MYHIAPSELNQTLTTVLAGGQGERLYPLTKDRSKPSVPFAGNYRIIDFSLSNCLNSGLRHIYLLTQYKSQSLDRHIRDGWNILNRELTEFIETVPPQHRTHTRWYEGTADAIYQNIYLLEQIKPDRVLVLSGDHIYRMDYNAMIKFHLEKDADVTIASFEFPRQDATPFGVMQVDNEDRVVNFLEKPSDPPPLPDNPDRSLINMGVYVFKTPVLVRAVIEDSKCENSVHDLGKNIFPTLIEKGNVNIFSYSFSRQSSDPYWRDVGSIASYFESNMALLKPSPSVNLFAKEWPFRTLSYQFPPSCFNLISDSVASVERSLVGAGCKIEGDINQCVISPGVVVGEGSSLENCIVFNGASIGKRCTLKNTIIDKSAVIPDDCTIGIYADKDKKQFYVTDEQLVVIPKGMIVEKHC